jgi:hypothetical protein
MKSAASSVGLQLVTPTDNLNKLHQYLCAQFDEASHRHTGVLEELWEVLFPGTNACYMLYIMITLSNDDTNADGDDDDESAIDCSPPCTNTLVVVLWTCLASLIHTCLVTSSC